MRYLVLAVAVLSASAVYAKDATRPVVPGITDAEYAARTHRAGRALLRSKRTAEAVDLAIDAAKARPTEASYEAVRTLSILASVHNDLASDLKGMHWLRDEAGEYGRSARFLGNLAHAEELAGNIDESINVRKQIVESDPAGEGAHQLEQIVRLYFHQGDQESARKYATALAEGDYPDNYREYGRRCLNRINGIKEDSHLEAPVPASSQDRGRPILVLIGVVCAILTVCLMLVVLLILRNQPHRQGNA